MRGHRRLVLLLVVLALMFAVSPALAVEEGGGPLDALGINVGFLLAQLINFGLLFGLLTVFLWRPITNALDARAEKISKGLEDASAAANARRNAEAEAEKILAQARAEAAKVVEESRTRGEEIARAIEAEARSNAEQIRTEARVSAETERNTQLAGLRDQVTAISMAVAQRLIGASLDQQRQKVLVDEFFTRLPQNARAISGPATVISAMPLSDMEQARVKEQLGTDNVTFRVDPSILGGLIVRAGERVIDGSVRSNMNDLAARLS